MAPWKALLLLGLLVVARVAAEEPAEEATEAEDDADDYAEADRAHLIVRKYFKETDGVQGRNLTVHLEVYNAGTATASDVQLKDGAVPDGFSLLEGVLEAALGKVDVGATATHSYVLRADNGSFGVRFEQATVTYVAEIDSTDKQVSHSSRPGIYVQTPVEQIQNYALIAGSYATLHLVTTPTAWRNLAVVGFVVAALLGGNKFAVKVKKDRTASSRARALKELENEQ